ncbi:hypothetical protein JTB14_026017 [Gonioctena quinquepunctata]|nr:hypothetical protein JTB14_026017 [Gonioctena quinquepunctata]
MCKTKMRLDTGFVTLNYLLPLEKELIPNVDIPFSLQHVILEFIRNTLEVACKPEDISDVFRMGNPHPKSGSRTILVKFVATSMRNEVYLAKKNIKHEDLSKGKYELYQLAQKKYGYKVWIMGNEVYFQNNNSKKEVCNAGDL